jgi:hypothetical protein
MIEFLLALMLIWAIFSLPAALVGSALVVRKVFAVPKLALRFTLVPWGAWLIFFLFVGRYGSLTTATISNVLVGLIEGVALTLVLWKPLEKRKEHIILGAATLSAVLVWVLVPVLGE